MTLENINLICRPVIEGFFQDGILKPSGLYPASDCLWCKHHVSLREPPYGHLCQGSHMKRNIYLTPCPCPEIREVIIPSKYNNPQKNLMGWL